MTNTPAEHASFSHALVDELIEMRNQHPNRAAARIAGWISTQDAIDGISVPTIIRDLPGASSEGRQGMTSRLLYLSDAQRVEVPTKKVKVLIQRTTKLIETAEIEVDVAANETTDDVLGRAEFAATDLKKWRTVEDEVSVSGLNDAEELIDVALAEARNEIALEPAS